MKKSLLLLPILMLFFAVGCAKKCKLKADTNEGLIVADAIVYPQSNGGGEWYVTNSTQNGGDALISLDGGYNRVPVDFSKYSLMVFPITTTCHVQFIRKVEENITTGILNYTIKVVDCPDCKEVYQTLNYVLIRKNTQGLVPVFKKL